MPNNCLSVLYKHIIQVEIKNMGLKVCVCVGGHTHTIATPTPPIKKVGNMPPPPPLLRQCIFESVLVLAPIIQYSNTAK